MRIRSISIVPRMVDANIVTTIGGVADAFGDVAFDDFVTQVNLALSSGLPVLSSEVVQQIIIDRQALGELKGMTLYDGTPPDAITRPDAPGRFAGSPADPDNFYFSTPTSGTFVLWAYKNGGLVYMDESPRDLAANRNLAGPVAATVWSTGDIMQIALVTTDDPPIGGWWAQYEVP